MSLPRPSLRGLLATCALLAACTTPAPAPLPRPERAPAEAALPEPGTVSPRHVH